MTTAKMKDEDEDDDANRRSAKWDVPPLGSPEEAQRSQAKLAGQSEAAEPRERTNVV